MTPNFSTHLKGVLSRLAGVQYHHIALEPVYGGCINKCYKIVADRTFFFLKTNTDNESKDRFKKEAYGLALLAKNGEFQIPLPLANGQFENFHWLILPWCQEESPSPLYWENLGSALAKLHKKTQQYFGLEQDNYIGSLPQDNTKNASFSTFFIENRLLPYLQHAEKLGHVPIEMWKKFDLLFKKIADCIPEEKPALLHGDLWSGNTMCLKEDVPSIFDPAVYYGHREIEIAFTSLFGGFPPQFYAAYQASNPLTPGFDRRKSLYQLHPLLVHLCLFGKTYRRGIEKILTQWV